MMHKRAVITGMGVVSPVGIGTADNWQALLAGNSGVAPFSRLPADHLPVSLGAEVRDFNPKQFIKDRKALRLTFLNVHLALAAAQLAYDDSGLAETTLDPARFGAIVGSGGGGFDDGPGFEDLNDPILQSWDEASQSFDSARFGERGVAKSYPLFLLKALPNNAFYYISLLYDIQGENDNIVSSYSGGTQAIGDAFRAVRRGLADVIIAGGYDSLLTPNTVFSLDSFGLLSHSTDASAACRPFDQHTSGMVAGEGAGFLIIEELEHARRRGARIYAEVVGYGNTSSAYHMYHPDPTGNGIRRSVLRSLEDAAAQPDEIDWVLADGIGTVADQAEAAALQQVFATRTPPVSAVKALTGHMGTGSGAAEAVYSVKALTEGVLPPTAGYTTPCAGCQLDIVRGAPRQQPIRTALNITQGIGGQCTALVFKRFD